MRSAITTEHIKSYIRIKNTKKIRFDWLVDTRSRLAVISILSGVGIINHSHYL